LKFVTKIREKSDLVYLVHLIGQPIVAIGKNILIVGHVLQIKVQLVRVLFGLAVQGDAKF